GFAEDGRTAREVQAEGRHHGRGRLRRVEPRGAAPGAGRRGGRPRRLLPRLPREPRRARGPSALPAPPGHDPRRAGPGRGRARRPPRGRAGGAHAGAHPAGGKTPRSGDALDTLVTNGEGGLQVLRACRDHGVRRMVLASTSDCYGRNPAVPFTEESASVIGSP